MLIENDVLRRNRISVGEILYTRRIEDVLGTRKSQVGLDFIEWD